MGQPGQQGPMGECSNSNPFCTQGPPGPTGAQGIPGPTGIAGLIGPTGAQGSVGPTGPSGPSGPPGPTGSQGVPGATGSPGVCNCLNLSLVNLINLGVNGTATLNGTTTINGNVDCPGGALAPNCFGLTTCPNFSSCNLLAQGLSVYSTNSSVIPQLQVGMQPGDAGKGVVNLGIPGGANITTLTSNVAGSYYMSTLNCPMLHRSWYSTATFESVGNTALFTAISSSGTVNITGAVGVSILAGPSNNVFISSGGNYVNINGASNIIAATASIINMTATDVYVNKGNLSPWWGTQSTASLTCQIGGLLPPSVGTSIVFSTDLIMASGTNLMSASSTGLISVSGLVLCGQLIKSASGTLQLQDNTVTKYLDIWATIQNADSGLPLTINDLQGVNFQQTPLFDNSGTSPLVVNDIHGMHVSAGPMIVRSNVQVSAGNATLYLNTNASSYAGGDVVISVGGSVTTVLGDLVVVGSLNAGSCLGCVSDERVKEGVREVPPHKDLETILGLPRRVSFRYSKDYQAVDRNVGDHVHEGFIAQELESVLPRAVHMMNQTIAGRVMRDFRRVLYDRIVPHVAGAMKEMHSMHMALRRDYDALRDEIRELKSKLQNSFP